MRLNEDERGPYNKLRDVSDLRTQFQCEYRLKLKQKLGDSSSKASITGSILHRTVSEQLISPKEKSRLLPLIVIIVTLVAGVLWILG